MRRRAAFYLLLGLVTAVLIVALATGLQTGGSTDLNVWLWAHRHLFLLQMLDMASAFLFVVISLYGLTVSRLQMQLQHQAEDFGDQMQTLVHRNEELSKVNEEYAEQIASLEAGQEAPAALSTGEGSQRVIAALHWQVDAQARQLEAVHRALEQQYDALRELQQHVHTLEESAAPPLAEEEAAPLLSDASVPASTPETAEAETATSGQWSGIADETVNDGSTLVGEILDFDVSAFAPPEPSPLDSPQPIAFTEVRTYPVDDSLLAMAAGHLSSMPEVASTPSPEPERVEISVGKGSAKPAPSEVFAGAADSPPARTQGALALDLAETALSSLQSETQEALSSLRAQVEATLPQATMPSAPASEPDKSGLTSRRKPWHLRF